MANSIVKLSVDDSSYNAKIKAAAQAFADFGRRVSSAGIEAFGDFAKGAKTAKVAFQGFNAALKANVLVLIASLAVEAGQALGEMIGNWIRGASDAEDAQRSLNNELEKTSLLLKEMSSSSKFNERLARAAGASTTEIIEQRIKDAEKMLDEASVRASNISRNKNATLDQINAANKMVADAQENLKKARQDWLVDDMAKRHRTGEYAQRGGGGGGGRSGGATVKMPTWDDFAKINIKTNQYLSDNLGKVLAEKQMPSVWEQMKGNDAGMRQMLEMNEKQWDYKKDITEQDYKNLPGYHEDEASLGDQLKDLSSKFGQFAGGLKSITSGISDLGIKIPKEINSVINVIQDASQIISGVGSIIQLFSTSSQALNTTAVSANTIAIGALTTAMYTNTATNLIPFLARGGIAKAANGFVPGNDHKDGIPVMVSSGELILNKAQQGVLASQLQGSGLGNLNLSATISGEQIRLVLNNNGLRTGNGEYVQTNFR